MRKQILLAGILATMGMSVGAQTQETKVKLSGFVRADYYANSRATEEGMDGFFLNYPKRIDADEFGNDRNSGNYANAWFFYTRLAVDATGPNLWGAKTSARVEADFRGDGNTVGLLRLRHAFVNLQWAKSALLIGQTWHPLFGDIAPDLLNLNLGAPFQPFSRAPQIRYRYKPGKLQLSAHVLWQNFFTSTGPKSNLQTETGSAKSTTYFKDAVLPEFYLGADYISSKLTVGAGVDIFTMVPRKTASNSSRTTKVNEKLTTLSPVVHAKYKDGSFYIAAKSFLGSNLTQTNTLGGMGVTYTDPTTLERTYTPLRTSASWINIGFGKIWRPSFFAGYIKQLGATKEVTSVYGSGIDTDQLATVTVELTYNYANIKLGAELNWSRAWYGTEFDKKQVATHHVSADNLRFVVAAVYNF